MYGEIVDTLPQGYIPREQWPEFFPIADTPNALKPTIVGINPVGIRQGMWPLYVEKYISDTEPDLSQSDIHHDAPNRFIVWRRVIRTDIPQGWRAFWHTPSQIEGFAELAPNTEYWTRWSESARRFRRIWLREFLGTKYTIEEISLSEFTNSYQLGTLTKNVKKDFLEKLERKAFLSKNTNALTLWGVRDLTTGQVVAGLATITSHQHKSSYYFCGFIHRAAEHDPVMLGAIDHWFLTAQKNGIVFLQFGRFWQKGDPKSWKGFSRFKSKFGLRYIVYPPELVRFVRGNFF